ncbi:MAG: hypothetical protein ACMVY4_00055 [Minwuia sp.]|uniref:hypothetical protein n=1 Tax=Minwuia sp. TaxID=2493630 RepID=UPI003A8AC0DA
MISDRAAGMTIAIFTIMVCAAVASTLDRSLDTGSIKIAGAGKGTTSELFQPTGLKGGALKINR